MLFIGLLLVGFQPRALAQIGGDNVYEFMQLPASARVAGLGGNLITVLDDDVALAYGNPATLNPQMHQHLSFSHNFYLASISNGYVSYGHHLNNWNATIHGGIQYINYGDFDATDIQGNITGTFGATEYAFNVGVGKRLYDKMNIGTNLRLVSSQLESYNSIGLAADVAAMYQDTASRFNATLVFKNIGGQLTAYHDSSKESIPFDVQLGISKKLKHLPFRVSVIAHNLHRWNILYDDPNQEQTTIFTGEEAPTENKFGVWVDNLFRHTIINGEFLLGKKENLRLRFGYNHLRRRELTVSGLRSLAGFSLGFGLKIKRFRIDYGRAFYHIAGGSNYLTISMPLTRFKGRRKR